ncbi:MAG: hypothetical protein HY901_12770 [Deltaproteobacteria bacterium]|nr:hypothetical protein [Deltaproteobacteria bacterium]
MSSLFRTAAIAAVTAVCGCAPAKLITIPAATYESAAVEGLTGDHGQLIENLRGLLKERRLALQVMPDASATMAAKMLANRLAQAKGVLPSEGRNMLHEAGIADVGARYFAASVGYNALVPTSEDLAPLLDSLGPVGGLLYVGAADIKDSLNSKRHWAVVVVPRVVAVAGLSRRFEPSTKLELKGRFLETVAATELELLKPDGTVDRSEMALAADGTFATTVEMPAAAGQYVVSILARFKGAERVLLAAPVGVGVPVSAWPPVAADLAVASEKELELALVKIVGQARGKPMAERKELMEAAKACAVAQAAGQECAPALAGSRMVAFDVSSDAVERMVSEIVAMPWTRAAWKPETGAVAAAPTSAGHFVVTVAFAE